MVYILLGCIAFLLFFLYDMNSVIFQYKPLNGIFFIGCLLLMIANIGIVVSSQDQVSMNGISMIVFGIFALGFLVLLSYTLFMALPFKETYTDSDSPSKVCSEGVYALCRHPGVLWFIGFYVFFWLALPSPLLLVAGLLFSALNLLYVIFQDQWTFLKTLADYQDYKKSTPFLFPTQQSIRRCIDTLHLIRR